jgi:hypothetical protein
MKDKTALSIRLCVGFLHCPPVTSKWFIVNFIMDLNEEINMLRDKYSDAVFLKISDVNCRIGEEQVELLHLFDVWEGWNAKSYNFGDKLCSKGRNCNSERKKLISFCVTNNFKILNGKF